MLTSHQSTLARVALAMGLTPAQAVALPAVVERSAGLVGMSKEAMASEILANQALRRYLADACRKVEAFLVD